MNEEFRNRHELEIYIRESLREKMLDEMRRGPRMSLRTLPCEEEGRQGTAREEPQRNSQKFPENVVAQKPRAGSPGG